MPMRFRPRCGRSFRSTVGAGCVACLLVGCQTYEPRPLDLDAHQQAWRDRTPSDATVRAFVDRLSDETIEAASAFDPSDGLRVDEAELVALVFNPSLRIARLKAGVAAATAEHAGRWDDPTFSIDVLRITENVSSPWVVTPGLAITIPISGRLRVEKSLADASLLAELESVAEAEWSTRFELRRRWRAWSAAMLRLDEQRRLIDAVGSLARTTDRLAEVGEMARTEAALFAIEASQRDAELRRLEATVRQEEQRLRAIMGLSPDAPISLVPTLAGWRTVAGEITEASPTLRRLHHEYEVSEQRLALEVRKQYPDLTIGPLYESDAGQSRIGLFGAIPIPVLNANRQGIAEAESERELARAAYETEYERLAGALAMVRLRAAFLEDEQTRIMNDLVPLVDRQLMDAEQLLRLGEGQSGGLVLLESLVRAHDTKMHLIEVRLERALADDEAAYLIGPPNGAGIVDDDTGATTPEGELP